MYENHRYILLSIFMMAMATVFSRVAPFAFLYRFKNNPHLHFLGRYLPPAVMLLLCIYCVRGTFRASQVEGLYAVVCSVLVAVLHVWKRHALMSIGVGSVLYILLVNYR